MSHNRKKHANSLPVATLARWIFVAFFIGVTGLGYVYLKNQLCSTGDEIKNMEHKLEDLITQNNVMHGKISTLSSRTMLQRRLNEGFIRMIPVSDDRIVRVNVQPVRIAGGEIRAVSNEVAAK
jgi:hypothetical protein